MPYNQPTDNANIKINGAFSNADQNVVSLMLGRYHKSEAITKGAQKRYL